MQKPIKLLLFYCDLDLNLIILYLYNNYLYLYEINKVLSAVLSQFTSCSYFSKYI